MRKLENNRFANRIMRGSTPRESLNLKSDYDKSSTNKE